MTGTTLPRQTKSSASTPPEHHGAWHFSPSGIAWRLFVMCWMVYALHFATNIVREIYPAVSLGDHLSFDVSEYTGLHPDIFELPGRGTFINNNPGASILGALPYALARPVIERAVDTVQRLRVSAPTTTAEYDTIYPMARAFYRQARERGIDVKLGLAAGIMQVFLMAPLSALSAVVMFSVLRHRTGSVKTSLWLAALYAFATPVFYRTAQLNHNLLLSHCALFAFVLLWRPWDEPQSPRRPSYLLAGMLSGWTVVLDYSGVVVLLGLSIYGLVRRASLPATARRPSDAWQFTAGVMLSAAVLLSYQWLAFGHPVFPAQHYMPATQLSHQGYNGMAWPQLDLLWETAFGMRFGVFTSAPLLLLAFYIPGWSRGRPGLLESREAWYVVVFCVAFFLFCAANQFGRLQFNSGVRYIVPAVPFLFLLAASVLLRLPTILAVLVGIGATYWSWCLAMYRDVEQGFGVFEAVMRVTLEGFRLPWLTTLERMGYVNEASTLPLFVLCGALLWALWRVRVNDAR